MRNLRNIEARVPVRHCTPCSSGRTLRAVPREDCSSVVQNFNEKRPPTAAGPDSYSPGEFPSSGIPQYSSFASNYGLEYEDLLAEMLPQYSATDIGQYTRVHAAREQTVGRCQGRIKIAIFAECKLPFLLSKRRASQNAVRLTPKRLQRRHRRSSSSAVAATPRRVI